VYQTKSLGTLQADNSATSTSHALDPSLNLSFQCTSAQDILSLGTNCITFIKLASSHTNTSFTCPIRLFVILNYSDQVKILSGLDMSNFKASWLDTCKHVNVYFAVKNTCELTNKNFMEFLCSFRGLIMNVIFWIHA